LDIEVWFLKDKYHRVGGPAYRYWADGQLVKEMWFMYDCVHRNDGPAVTSWGNDGRLIQELWRLDGLPWTEEKIEEFMRPDAYKFAIATLPQPIAEEIWEEFRTA
jgi:hypothetical protein